MKVYVYSRRAIEELLRVGKIEGAAVISFYDPEKRGKKRDTGYRPVDFRELCDKLMKIGLHDLDPEALSDFGLSPEEYFPEADELAGFIYEARERGLDIICQCEYGQSRSAGCAAAILQHFFGNGIDIFADYRYYPNQLVYHKVLDALGRRAEK